MTASEIEQMTGLNNVVLYYGGASPARIEAIGNVDLINRVNNCLQNYDLESTNLVAALLSIVSPPIAEISKLTLKRRLEVLGKWSEFKALLTQLPATVQDDWTLASAIRADDPIFVSNASTIKAALGLTDEQFDALLE